MTQSHLIKGLAYAALCVFSTTAHAQSADTVFIHGKILTVDSDFTITQSLAIADGHIIAVGNNETTEPFIGDDTQVISLDGKTVIPGLIDNHFHFIRGVWNNQLEARFDGITSRKLALQHLMEKAQQSEPGTWVTVMGGWSLDQFQDDNSLFMLEEMNEVAPMNPLLLMRTYSEGFANKRAFDLANLDNDGNARLSGRDGLSPLINHELRARKFGSWVHNPIDQTVTKGRSRPIKLTSVENRLITVFLDNPYTVLSRGMLLERVMQREEKPYDRAVDNKIGRLRKKLETDPSKPTLLLTEWGGGYKFMADVIDVSEP